MLSPSWHPSKFDCEVFPEQSFLFCLGLWRSALVISPRLKPCYDAKEKAAEDAACRAG